MILMTYVAGSEIFITVQNSSEFILVIKKKEYCHLSFPLLSINPSLLYGNLCNLSFLILLCCMERPGKYATGRNSLSFCHEKALSITEFSPEQKNSIENLR